jgi:hypothetical protein
MQPVSILKTKFEEYCGRYSISRAMEITDRGLVLGAGTVLAQMGHGRGGTPILQLEGNEERLLALLAVAYSRSVPARVIGNIKRAHKQWASGDKCLAQIELAFAGLPQLANYDEAFSLYLADALIKDGMSPQTLMKELGYGPNSLDLYKYDPNQPRVPVGNGRESGRWTNENETAHSRQPSTIETSNSQRQDTLNINSQFVIVDPFCKIVKELCIGRCSGATLASGDFGFRFYNCVNKCMDDHGCLGMA